jgi:hypothetical protein
LSRVQFLDDHSIDREDQAMPLFPRRNSQPQLRPTAQPLPQPEDPTPAAGHPVNPVSRAVLPKEQFPLHFDLLMRDLWTRGMSPEDFQIIAADEVRLDEDGMDVEFTLLRIGTDAVFRRRVDVRHGRMVGIRDC